MCLTRVSPPFSHDSTGIPSRMRASLEYVTPIIVTQRMEYARKRAQGRIGNRWIGSRKSLRFMRKVDELCISRRGFRSAKRVRVQLGPEWRDSKYFNVSRKADFRAGLLERCQVHEPGRQFGAPL
jgi:hypothetical protein